MKDQLSQIEACIRAAEFWTARQLFGRINLKQVPRSSARYAASLARRCGLIGTSLRLLNPIVRDIAKSVAPASEEEIADYAFSLYRSGATFEAEKLFRDIGDGKTPETYFFRSLLDFSKWRYDSAAPLLEKYLRFPTLTGYQRTIGKLNLAAALVQLHQSARAWSLVNEVSSDKEAANSKLVQGLLLELQVQLHFHEGNLQELRNSLDNAGRVTQGSSDRLQAWIKKWSLLYQMRSTGEKPTAEQESSLHALAWKFKNWEHVRELDYYKLEFDPNEELYCRLTFGTPHSGFLKRIESLPVGFSQPAQWSWTSANVSPPTRVFDLKEGVFKKANGDVEAAVSGQLLRLVRGLCKDLYSPSRTGSVFSELFPEEYFDPFHSPNRVHQTMFRLNSTLSELGLSDLVVNRSGHYVVELPAHFGIVLHQGHLDEPVQLSELDEFRDQVGTGEFKLVDLCRRTKLSPRTAQRTIQKGLKADVVDRVGAGKNTRYRFKQAA